MPGPSSANVEFYVHTCLYVVVELEHCRGCWPVLINSEKHGLTCANADFERRSMMADFGLERISRGIPAEFAPARTVARGFMRRTG